MLSSRKLWALKPPSSIYRFHSATMQATKQSTEEKAAPQQPTGIAEVNPGTSQTGPQPWTFDPEEFCPTEFWHTESQLVDHEAGDLLMQWWDAPNLQVQWKFKDHRWVKSTAVTPTEYFHLTFGDHTEDEASHKARPLHTGTKVLKKTLKQKPPKLRKQADAYRYLQHTEGLQPAAEVPGEHVADHTADRKPYLESHTEDYKHHTEVGEPPVYLTADPTADREPFLEFRTEVYKYHTEVGEPPVYLTADHTADRPFLELHTEVHKYTEVGEPPVYLTADHTADREPFLEFRTEVKYHTEVGEPPEYFRRTEQPFDYWYYRTEQTVDYWYLPRRAALLPQVPSPHRAALRVLAPSPRRTAPLLQVLHRTEQPFAEQPFDYWYLHTEQPFARRVRATHRSPVFKKV